MTAPNIQSEGQWDAARDLGLSLRTLELGRRDDLDGHDRLEDDRPRSVVNLTERADDREPEGQLGRIDRVRETVVEHKACAADGVTRERTLL